MKISISVVMFTAILVASLTTGLVGFIPTYEVGKKGIDDTVALMRANVIRRVDASLKVFFARPAAVLDNVVDMGNAGIDIVDTLGLNTGDPRRVFTYLCSVVLSMGGVTTGAAFQYAGSPDSVDPNHRGQTMTCDYRFAAAMGGFPLVGTNQPATGHYPGYLWNQTARAYAGSPGPRINPINLTYDMKSVWAVQFAEQQVTEAQFFSSDYRWGGVGAGYDTIRISSQAPFTDIRGNRSILQMGILPFKLRDALFADLQLTSGSRVMLLDSRTSRTFGLSWGEEPSEQLPSWQNQALPDNQRFIFKNASDVSDPLVRKVTATLGGDRSYFNLPDSYATTLYEGKDRTFVDVKRFRNPYGLDIRMVVLMPEDDFVGDINAQQTNTIIVLVCVMVVMLVLAVIFSILLSRPLNVLGDRMRLTASLQDEDDASGESMLSEIAEMQAAYEQMKKELNRMKAYLPQSLISAQNGDDDDDEEGDVDDSKSGRSIGSSHNRSSVNVRSTENGSVRSLSTRQSSAKGGVVAGLAMTRQVTSRRVVVAVFNLCGFQSAVQTATGDSGRMTRLQKTMLDVVKEHATVNKGVVDTFQGDHVVVTFNAVMNCASAGKRAAVCASSVCEALAKVEQMPPATVGLAASLAMVGNTGTDGLLRFNVVGPCVPDAYAMERLARARMHQQAKGSEQSSAGKRPWCIVLSQNLIVDVELDYLHESFDIVHCSTSTKVVAILHGTKSMAMEEWMYQLEEAEGSDPFKALNEAFSAVAASKPEAESAAANVKDAVARARLGVLVSASSITEAASNVLVFPAAAC